MLEQHKLTDFTLKPLKSFIIQNALYLTMSKAHKSTCSRSLTRISICRCIHDNYHRTNYGNKFFFYNLKNLFRKFPGVFSTKVLFETGKLRQRAYATLLFHFFFRFMQASDCQTRSFRRISGFSLPNRQMATESVIRISSFSLYLLFPFLSSVSLDARRGGE